MPDPTMEFPRALGEQDTLLWRMERNPIFRSTLLAIVVLDRPPQRDALVAKLERAGRDLPRMRQRILAMPELISTPLWVHADHFDMDYHLRWIKAPGDGSLQAVIDLAGTISMAALDPHRPPWEFYVVEEMEGGRAAVILKLHHAVTDGVGGVVLMGNFFDQERNSPPPRPITDETERLAPETDVLSLSTEALQRRLAARPGQLWRGAGRLLAAGRRPAESLSRIREDVASLGRMMSAGPGPLSPIMEGRSTNLRFRCFDVPLSGLKDAAHSVDCKLGDAFLAGVTGALRIYHEQANAPVEALNAAVPVNRRGESEGPEVAGVEMAVARLPLPIAEENPGRRMRLYHELIAEQRNEPSQGYSDAFAGMLNRLPIGLALQMYGATALRNDFVASSVPGLPFQLYTAGAKVESFLAFGPCSGSAVNFTLFSYRDCASIAVTSDAAAVRDPDALLECAKVGFEEVLKLA
jgi:WS/DGAT/MGAT family acyltransferase